MGKGTIEAGGPEGLYTVRLNLDRTRIDQRLAELEKALAFLEGQELPRLESELEAAQAALAEAQGVVDAAIAEQDLDAMNAGAHQVALAAGERDRKAAARDIVKLRRLALERERLTLQARMPDDPVLQLWCADATEDLSGTVATVEIPGERGGIPPLIRPGFNGQAAYSPARDGQLQPVLAATPWSVYYNWGLLPGWQKWKPTYRLGTIAMLEGDTCTVDLDAAHSSAQDLAINRTDSLTEVPIVYMNCNGDAFEVGDRVVVQFQDQDWSRPQVIGFQTNPQSCQRKGFLCIPASNSAPGGWGEPFTDSNGEPINPPLGSPGSSRSAVVMGRDRKGQFTVLKRGLDDMLATGRANRSETWIGHQGSIRLVTNGFNVWWGEKRIASKYAKTSLMYAVGVFSDAQGQKWLWTMGVEDESNPRSLLFFYKKPWDSLPNETGLFDPAKYETYLASGDEAQAEKEYAKWRVLGTYDLGPLDPFFQGRGPRTGRFVINESGNEALGIIGRDPYPFFNPTTGEVVYSGYMVVTPEPFSVTAFANTPIATAVDWSDVYDEVKPQYQDGPAEEPCDFTGKAEYRFNHTQQTHQSGSGQVVIDVAYQGDTRQLTWFTLTHSYTHHYHETAHTDYTDVWFAGSTGVCFFDRYADEQSSSTLTISLETLVDLVMGDWTLPLERQTYNRSFNTWSSRTSKNGQTVTSESSSEQSEVGSRRVSQLWYLHSPHQVALVDDVEDDFNFTGDGQGISTGRYGAFRIVTRDNEWLVSDPINSKKTPNWWGDAVIPVGYSQNQSDSYITYTLPMTTVTTAYVNWMDRDWYMNLERDGETLFFSVPKIIHNKFPEIIAGVDTSQHFNYLTGADPVVISAIPGDNPRFEFIGIF